MSTALDRLLELGVVVDKGGSLIAALERWELESTVVRKKGGSSFFFLSLFLKRSDRAF